MAKRRTIAECHIHELLRGSLLDPAYSAQSFRSPGRVAIGEALDAVLMTRPPLATVEALAELLDACNKRANEIRMEER